MDSVKTTVDISDALFTRAKKHAHMTHRPMRALIEEGLRHVLDGKPQTQPFKLTDASVGRPGGFNPLDAMSWSDLRNEIYGRR